MPNDAIALLKPVHSTVSQRIRERLLARRTRYFANDNIAASIEPGELDELARRLYGRIRVHLQQELRHDRERLGLLINRR
jgi:GTP cyclohydrolase I